MRISGFTFGHNLISSGYPIVEAVKAVRPYVDEVIAVDMESTDNTRAVLDQLGCKVLTSPWADATWRGDTVLVQAFNLNLQYCGDAVVFFEADEVYDDRLIGFIHNKLEWDGPHNFAVQRVQLEMNFQRVRWYPIPVHRVFPRGDGSYPLHPTIPPDYADVLPPELGYLWDCAACFRDNYITRKQTQAELWTHVRRLRVAKHFAEPNEYQDEAAYLAEPEWTWRETPLVIPDILRHHLGKTRYEVHL